MFDIVALGELLIDFTPVAENTFKANEGGAPANLAVAAARLGAKTAFAGKVGQDQFGAMLRDCLQKNGVNTEGLLFTEKAPTTLAFVHLDEQGDRSFTFIRKPGADMLLEKGDLPFGLIEDAKVFHFGSVSMTAQPARDATLLAAKRAREKGIFVSYDPNLRPLLWPSLEEARRVICQGIEYADLIKISEEELAFITGETDCEIGSKMLLDQGIQIVLVTLGAKGCFYRYAGGYGQMDTYDTKVVDTTGAGDSCLGGFLYRLISKDLSNVDAITQEEMRDMVDFANATGACTVTQKGGIPALPTLAQVERVRKELPRIHTK